MIIAGLDISTSCGVALIEPSRAPSTWRALAIESEGETWARVDDFDGALRDLFTRHRPDFAAIERPLGVVVDYGGSEASEAGKPMINATTTITLAGLAGCAIGVLNGLGIPFGFVSIATWRAAYFGRGFKPQRDWKASAIDLAAAQGVVLPETKKAARDAAEAVGIAVSWKMVNWVPRRHQAAFVALRTGGRAVA